MKTKEECMWTAQGHSTHKPTREPITDEEVEEFSRKLKEQEEIRAAEKQKQREKEDAEITRLVAELDELRKLMPKEKIDLEEVLRESEAHYKALPMWDFGAREMSNEHDMSQKYGSRITNEIRRCQWDAEHIPKSLIADMHRIHEGKLPLLWKKQKPAIRPTKKPERVIDSKAHWDEIKEKKSHEPKQYRHDHFTPVKVGLFNVARLNRDLQNPTTLLLYLLQHRTWEGKKDKHDTYDTWYLKRGLIVASVGVEKICVDLGVHEKTVRNWTNALHKSGVIRKLKSGREGIYVLGEVIDNKELYYYSGEISWKPKPGPVH